MQNETLPDVIVTKVTRQDLKGDYFNRFSRCPIHQSLKRQFNTLYIEVGKNCVFIDMVRYDLIPSDDLKARRRGNGKLLGKILGGFTVRLKRPIFYTGSL